MIFRYNCKENELSRFGIYKISFIGGDENEIYIGQTSKSFKIRFDQHFYRFNRGIGSKRVRKMIEKYGISNMIFSIVKILNDKSICRSEEEKAMAGLKPILNFEYRAT